ncbi:MAG: hypothetical protein F6K41_08835 [Symploca sp. SIO3E6]|nr:hypothetical protein [Caldora sp. SIO3E6]
MQEGRMTVCYYEMVKSCVEHGDLKIICIISPARVGSTFFMNVLAQSPSVHGFINQPFHLTYSYPYVFPGNREEIAYQRIWETYQQVRKLHYPKTITLVLKCMARNLGIGQQIRRFIQLIEKSIILIRNPLLSIDSLLKMQVISIEDMPEASQHNFDNYALQQGVMDQTGHGHHWRVLRDLVLETKNYRLITDLLIETLAFIELNQYEIDMLNDYQYRFNDDDGSFNHVFALNWTGWDNMAAIYERYMSSSMNYLVVDSTILRAIPEKVSREVSHALNIRYSPQMLNNWKVVKEKIMDNTILKTSWMKSCYNTVTNSSGVKLPKEAPIPINLFPYIYQQHILNTAYPSYFALLKTHHTIRPRSHEEMQVLLNTTVTEDGKLLKQVDPIFAQILLLLSV